jgi:hypothetical protein
MHLIRQHIFDIQCSSRDFGKEIQSQLGTLLEKEFYPKLDTLLHRYGHDNHTWHIDLLELQLPKITSANWKYEVIQKSLQQIEDYLRNNRPIIQAQGHDEAITPHRFIPDGQYAVSLFFNFLKTGVLPENAIAKELDKIVSEIEVSAVFLKQLIAVFEADAHCLTRWIFAVPNVFKAKVMDFSNGFSVTVRIFLFDVFSAEKQYSPEVRQIIQKFQNNNELISQWVEWIQWFNYLYQKGVSRDAIFKEMVVVCEQFWTLSPIEIKTFFTWITDRLKADSKSIDKQIEVFFQAFHESIPTVEVQKAAPEEAAFPKAKAIRQEEYIYVGNAGLIILHPFLKTLFEKLEWCEDEVWNTKIYQHKAVLLTQYLVTGQEKMGENELVLNKILCGFRISETVNTKLKITKTEKEQALSLLHAVLEHWKAMSGSSVEALQETFLQREGKLELLANDTYELWVEEKGYDILLEQLPWGIGMVKTPWMEDYLTCHWS